MKSLTLVILIAAISIGAVSGVRHVRRAGSDDSDNGRETMQTIQEKLQGTWYEQSLNGGVVEISGSNITYKRDDYSDRSRFRLERKDGHIQLTTADEYFMYVDIWYEADADELICHTWPLACACFQTNGVCSPSGTGIRGTDGQQRSGCSESV